MPAGRDGQGGVDAPCSVNTTPPSAAAGASETSYDRLFLPYRRQVESESLSTPTKWISIPRRKSDAGWSSQGLLGIRSDRWVSWRDEEARSAARLAGVHLVRLHNIKEI